MNLMTILNPRHPMFPGERRRRLAEWAWREVAHRLPRKLAYWSFIDTGVRHIAPDEIVPEVPYMTLLERFSPR